MRDDARAYALFTLAAALMLALAGSPAAAQDAAKPPPPAGEPPKAAERQAWPAAAEDDGAIDTAGAFPLNQGDARRIRAFIGNGPHGATTGDFDWFSVGALAAGERLVVDVDTTRSEGGGPGLDAVAQVFAWDGVNPPTAVTVSDDNGRGTDPYVVYTVPVGPPQTLYVRVRSFGNLQGNAFDSGSGNGAVGTGGYDLVVGRFGSLAGDFPQFLMDSGSLWLNSQHADLVVTNTNAAAANRVLLTLENNGAPLMFYRDTSSANPGWQESLFKNDSFGISRLGTGGAEFQVFPDGRVDMGPGPNVVFRLFPTGNLTINGTLTQGSDRAAKVDLQPVDAGAILERLAGLQLHTWAYRHSPGVRHLGPTAQNFAAAFGLGASDTGIAAVDADGVALAAIQALVAENAAKDARIAELEARVAAVEALLSEGLSRG